MSLVAATVKTKAEALVLIFFVSFLLLMSSGRLASYDAGTQLQAAMLLATTGKLGTSSPPGGGGGSSLWVRNSTGTYYQCHDIGNTLLMFPAAWVSSKLAHGSASDMVENPPISARVGVALTYSILSAVACFFLFRFFRLYYDTVSSFLISAAFVGTTIFLPYTKSAWDVLGAACFVSALLFFVARLRRSELPFASALCMGVTAAAACSFRFSLAPFLVIAAVVMFWSAGSAVRMRERLICASVFLAGILPSLYYNYVRMGSPFRPATTAQVYVNVGTANLSGNILSGLYGLLLSPNKGLFIFSPIFVLLAAYPFVRKRVPVELRQIIAAFVLAAALHILLLAKIRGWGSFGWGPRYLVAVLPILFLPVGVVLVEVWQRFRRPLAALVCLSAILTAAPSLVNWSLAIEVSPSAQNQYAVKPYQEFVVWNGLARAMHGKPLPAPQALLDDPIRSASARFPDLWTVRLMERSRGGFVAGSIVLLLLTGLSVWTFRRLIFSAKRQPDALNEGAIASPA